MESALTCILVVVVSIFPACSCEFTQKYQYLSLLLTDFMIECFCLWNVVFESYSVRFVNFHGSPELKWAPAAHFTWRTGQVSCNVLFTSLHIFSFGFISVARVSQSMSSTSACSDSHFLTTKESWIEDWSCWKWFIPLGCNIHTKDSITFCKMCRYWRLSRW